MIRRRLDVPHLAGATTALTFLLILLGVYTAAVGAGLACSAQWPLCDGGLLPQTLPSFVEWFHRLVAMVTGVAILGTAAGAWRRFRDRRIRVAAALSVFALPVQVLLGGATVVAYTPVVQTAHHGAAMVIFGALLATTLWTFEAAGTGADAAAGADADAAAGPAGGEGDAGDASSGRDGDVGPTRADD